MVNTMSQRLKFVDKLVSEVVKGCPSRFRDALLAGTQGTAVTLRDVVAFAGYLNTLSTQNSDFSSEYGLEIESWGDVHVFFRELEKDPPTAWVIESGWNVILFALARFNLTANPRDLFPEYF